MNLRLLFLFGLMLSFVSCSTDFNILESVESISITADRNSRTIGESVTFRVLTNSGRDITEEATIYVNGTPIDSNEFVSVEVGTFTFNARYFSVQSEPITVLFHDGSEINFTKRVLIEDYTGTWCGFCPRLVVAIDRVMEQTSYAVPVAIHRSSSNPNDANFDPFNFDSSIVEALPGIPAGYPKGMLNRTIRWTPLEQNNVPMAIALTQGENPKLGLALKPSIQNNQLTIEVKGKFAQNFENLRLVVYVLENGLIYDQVNYTNFFGAQNPIPNFVHDHVLRACLTHLLGDPIPNSQTTTGSTFSRTFQVAVPSNISDINKIEFVAFISNADHRALNVRKAYLNEDQDFEEY